MPSVQKRKVIEKTRKREKRGRIYLLLAIVLIIIVGVGVYVYASSQSPPKIVYAKLSTSKGLIEVELYQSQTPTTVTNFVNLAKSGFYNNLVWHRIHPGFVIQTGDPNTRNGGGDNKTWGQGGSSQTIPLEIDSSLHNYAGYLGMARSTDPNSGSSQFYINLGDNSATLDGKYTVFGKVISGMDAANAIGNVPIYTPPDGQPITLVFLTNVTISNSP
jgi:dolichyl-diphosphooligosaccharide--protein glycosyltransferase